MPADARERLMDNVAAAMQGVPREIVQRQVIHFHRADPAYGAGVARRMGVPAPVEAQAAE
jgi:catalase